MNSIYAEQSLCGAVLIDARCLDAARAIVRPEDFQMEQTRAVFAAALRLADAGEAVDPVTIQAEAAKTGCDLPNRYLAELMEITPTAANALQHARIVRDAAVRRSAAELAENVLEWVGDTTKEPNQLIADIGSGLRQIENSGGPQTLESPDATLDFVRYLEQLESGAMEAAVRTGYRSLDAILGGGMIRQGLYYLGARPGVGKTTFALKIAEEASKHGAVLFVSLEMSAEQITARRLADESGIGITRLLFEPHQSEDEAVDLQHAAVRISERRFLLNRKPSASVADIAAMAHGIRDLRLVVIDYLGLIRGEKSSAPIYERVTQVSNDLKRLARSLNVPILCLAQLNRAVEQRSDKTPSIADLRDSGATEQDADGVLLLHRPSMYWPESERPTGVQADRMEVHVVKNRHGSRGIAAFDFYGVNGRVVPASYTD